METEEKRYTAIQIAALLQTSPETVRRWIRAGKLQVRGIEGKGRKKIVFQSDLNKFLAETPKYAKYAKYAECFFQDNPAFLSNQLNLLVDLAITSKKKQIAVCRKK